MKQSFVDFKRYGLQFPLLCACRLVCSANTTRGGVLAFFTLLTVTAAPVIEAGDTISLPLRWCALDSTPAVTNPMNAPPNPYTGDPEPDTDNVLWRRHERATDNIWNPGADITFRSGITAAIRDNASFPVIPDPCPPTNVPLCQGGANVGLSCTPDGASEDPAVCGAGVSCAVQTCPSQCTPAGINMCVGNLGDVAGTGAFCQSGPNQGQNCSPDNAGQDTGNCGAGVTCARDLTEYNLAISACTQAWDVLTGSTGTNNSTNLLAQTAVNIGVFRNPDGMRDGLLGRAQRSQFDGNNCANPPTGVTMATNGAIVGIDNQNFLSNVAFEQMNERMIAHELGHTLELWHGDGTDNDTDTGLDQVCDPAQDEEPAGPSNMPPAFCFTPTTFMSSTSCGNVSTAMTNNQRLTAREFAEDYTGSTMDPPGTLIPGPNVGDQRTDRPVDVSDTGIDIVHLTIQENVETSMASFSHRLFGVIPLDPDSERQYVVFADLDGNTGTGGAPSVLGFSTGFQGAELVTRVVVSGVVIPILEDNGPAVAAAVTAPLAAVATVWRFENGAFQEVNDPQIRAFVFEISGGDDSSELGDEGPPTVDAHSVILEMPAAVRGAIGEEVRIQALAEQLSTTIPPPDDLQLDRLPDEPLDGARVFRPVLPEFPVCLATPNPVQPGSIATVEASGLFENETAKVVLGDRVVAQGPIDADGNALLNFLVPSTTPPGPRLVTVGVVGTALTADCTVEVLDSGEPPAPAVCDPNTPGAIIGTAGADLLFGTPGDDVIIGLEGNDSIFGQGGNDCIDGGDGNDRIAARDGDNRIIGGFGNDLITSGSGTDTITGGPDNDSIFSRAGDDRLTGGLGNDRIAGDGGNDEIDGGPGNDLITGGSGTDTITGGPDNDSIFSGTEDDRIIGGSGDDRIAGDGGNDEIDGGPDNDLITGGQGTDTCENGELVFQCE